MKQYLIVFFVLAFGLVGCAGPSELPTPPTPTLPAPLITIVETDNATATPSPAVDDTADATQLLPVEVMLFDVSQLPECIPPADLESLGYEWRDCTLTEIEGGDGWAAVEWGNIWCNSPGQLLLANLNTGELRRFQDRPVWDFFGETAAEVAHEVRVFQDGQFNYLGDMDETAVWGNALLKYRGSITSEKWLLSTDAPGCHGGPSGLVFLYDVATDNFRLSPLDGPPEWNEARTAGIQGVWGYEGLFDQYLAKISGYHVLTDQSFRVSGDGYMWTPDESHVLLQTITFELTRGTLPTDSTFYDLPGQDVSDWPLVIFSPPRSIQLANMATGEVTLLAGEDGYSYWLCEWEEVCAWQGDWLPIRRIVEQPAHTLARANFSHPNYRCYTTANDCPVPVEYFLLNWRTGERTSFVITAPTPTPPPPSSP